MTTITDGTLSATANAANQIATFTGPFTLTGNVTATSQGANAVIAVLTGSVGGTGNLTKNLSTMTLTLAGANTFTGTTRVNLGNLFLANTLALQNSTLDTQTVVNGNTVFDQTVVTNAFTFGGLSGSRNLALVNNAGTPAAVTLSVGNNGANTTYSGALTGAGTLTKIGGGTLTLNGINVNTGGTNVNAGVVKGTGRLGGLTSVNTGGTLRAGDSTIGTLELSNGLAVNTGGTLFVQITNGSTPAAAGTGGSTLGTLPNPTSNNFYHLLAGTTSFDPNAQFTFDATGVTFTEGATYSYQIAQGAGNQSALSFGAANITPIGVDLNPLYTSITGSAGGAVYLNFVPIPEPALLLVVAGIFGLTRIRRR
jgi:autotransporter-associated beta strand protein